MRNLLIGPILIGLCLLGSTLFSQRTYTDNSVLSQGSWHKLAIAKTGMYRLDRNYLQQLGLNIGSIDPRNIKMYGHDGGMLPQLNSAPRYDDLKEMAIEVVGQDDGSLDNNDFVRFFARGPHVWNYAEASDDFSHSYNHYSDSMYVFLTVGNTPGLRVDEAAPLSPTYNPANLRSTDFHESEQYNLLKSIYARIDLDIAKKSSPLGQSWSEDYSSDFFCFIHLPLTSLNG
mgnify:CR=1 FL=1